MKITKIAGFKIASSENGPQMLCHINPNFQPCLKTYFQKPLYVVTIPFRSQTVKIWYCTGYRLDFLSRRVTKRLELCLPPSDVSDLTTRVGPISFMLYWLVMSNQRFLKIVCFRFPTNVPQKNRIYSFLKQNSLSNQNVLFQI